MIYSLRGKIIEKFSDAVVIDCMGVGYICKTTDNTLASIGSIGSEASVYTYMNIYQDGIDLFGFNDKEELNCFRMLISVSGVGPKAALSVLSVNTPQQFAFKVASKDSKGLTSAKGVGKKMADRIILELRDKISETEDISVSADKSVSSSEIYSSDISDAVSALIVLGYEQSEIMPYLKDIDTSKGTSYIIKQVLKMIGSK